MNRTKVLTTDSERKIYSAERAIEDCKKQAKGLKLSAQLAGFGILYCFVFGFYLLYSLETDRDTMELIATVFIGYVLYRCAEQLSGLADDLYKSLPEKELALKNLKESL